MARAARKMGESGFYHVILKGVGGQVLFEDDADRAFFMDRLGDVLGAEGVSAVAWCLMSNHVHLVLHADMPAISRAVRRLGSSYALHYNARHDRSGALFQGRFTSVPVETDEQLCSAVRYVHLNPVKAGGLLGGPWSSYDDYARGVADGEEARMLLEMLGGPAGVRLFHQAADDYGACLPRQRLTDSQAVRAAHAALAGTNPYDVRALPRDERDASVRDLHAAGLSMRQICRVTSLGRGIVEHAIHG